MDDEDRYTRITLRIPKELHSQLTDEAERTSKSLNAEIVARLQESFTERVPTDLALILAALESVIARSEVEKFEVGTQAYHLAWALDRALKENKLPEATPQLQEDILRAMEHSPYRPGITEMRLTKAQIAALRVQTMATVLAAREAGADVPDDVAKMPARILKDARRHLKQTKP